MFVFGVIAARGGSKGLPGKNVKHLKGLPLIAWTVQAAAKSRLLSRVIVSTDDRKIANAAKRYGAEVPFTRPARLSTDTARIEDMLKHAVAWLRREEGITPDVVVLLQATSPFRSGKDIDETVALVTRKGADSAETVALDDRHPYHRYHLAGSRLTPWGKTMARSTRRQDFKPVYRPTGSVYAVRTEVLLKTGKIKGGDHRGVVLGERASVDIDSAWDFDLAQYLAAGFK